MLSDKETLRVLSCTEAHPHVTLPARASQTSREERKRIKALERELARKERALAEAAALLVLRKKAAAIWGEEEDE